MVYYKSQETKDKKQKTIYRGDSMINLVFSSVMFIMFNVLIFSTYFYMNNKYKDIQSSLLEDLKKAIKILLVLDTIILMILIYLFSIM